MAIAVNSGTAALIVALRVIPSVLAREAPLSMLAVLLFAYFTSGGLERWEGMALLGALVGALVWIIAGGRVDHPESHSLDDGGSLSSQALRTAGGLVGTIAGVMRFAAPTRSSLHENRSALGASPRSRPARSARRCST